jgi:hypothetical protein
MVSSTEKERGEGKQGESFCPSSGREHHNFSDDGYSEYAIVAESKQDFLDKETKKIFPLLWYIKLFHDVIEAFRTLTLEKYVVKIQLPGKINQLLSITKEFYTEFWNGSPLEISLIPSRHMTYKYCCSGLHESIFA